MCFQDVAGDNVDVVGRTGHGIEPQKQLKMGGLA
jgi:hypothetical protein